MGALGAMGTSHIRVPVLFSVVSGKKQQTKQKYENQAKKTQNTPPKSLNSWTGCAMDMGAAVFHLQL